MAETYCSSQNEFIWGLVMWYSFFHQIIQLCKVYAVNEVAMVVVHGVTQTRSFMGFRTITFKISLEYILLLLAAVFTVFTVACIYVETEAAAVVQCIWKDSETRFITGICFISTCGSVWCLVFAIQSYKARSCILHTDQLKLNWLSD